MLESVKRIFLDPSRCIGCRSCVAACRKCDTHKGESMIYIDYIERYNTVASSPTLCMHCEDPLSPCAQVCAAQAILVSPVELEYAIDKASLQCYNAPHGKPQICGDRATDCEAGGTSRTAGIALQVYLIP